MRVERASSGIPVRFKDVSHKEHCRTRLNNGKLPDQHYNTVGRGAEHLNSRTVQVDDSPELLAGADLLQ